MNTSFYAPVNMGLLENYSIEIQLYEIEKVHKHQEQLYSLEIHGDEDWDEDLVRQVAVHVNLNPQHVRMVGNNILQGGEVCKLKGRDGYWCWMTPCSSCFKNKTRQRCETPNCANNILFRRQFIHDG